MSELTESSAGNAEPLRPGASVKKLPGVGPAKAGLLARLEIHTVTDLLRHLPVRYEPEAAEGLIADLPADGQSVGSARGVIAASRWVGGQFGKKGRYEATLQDDSGGLLLTWFNAAYLRDRIRPGQPLRVHGKAKLFSGYPQMVNPKWELMSEDEAQEQPGKAGRLRPVYPATQGLPSSAIEKLIATAIERVTPKLEDPLPAELLAAHNMPDLATAFRQAHRPTEPEDHLAARRRLAYNELLLLQLGIAMKRAYVHQRQAAPAILVSDAVDRHIRERFAFVLTPSQDKVIQTLRDDLSQSQPMNRLVQGDVGSGKTVVALYAMLAAVAQRKQAAMMAPTELLAEQHHRSISSMLKGSSIRVRLLTAGQGASGSAARNALLEEIVSGEADIVVGTQALVTQAVRFKELAVAVVDEQHRFGVMQRARLRSAGETDEQGRLRVPHQLVMTATPIPRTLSLTIFGDLDISTITGKPPGRVPIQSRVVGPEKIDEVYAYLKARLARGEQAYVVVPVIDGPGQSEDSGAMLKNVADTATTLRQKLGPPYEVVEVHGRLPREERERVMQRFRTGQAQLLVATTVIEVGVDVPNASVMIVEHAERFGLSQLHQLRGRIGRGASTRRPLCVFIADPTTEDAEARMKAIAATSDGFKIAEQDLAIRGMGDFFGTRQSGMPPLRTAVIPDDMDLLALARQDAQAMIERDWRLSAPEHAALRKVLLQSYGESLGLIDVG
ncbi:MAG: ATP-dependent DNA helicase RecG [Planctomycetota bacterium]